MTRVESTALPGVGHLHVLSTASGRCVGVIRHYGDRRELIVYHSDPDATGISLMLTRDEAEGIAELLGAGDVARHVARLEHHAHGVVTLQLMLGAGSPTPSVGAVGRAEPGAAIVAVVRDGEVLANPAPDLRLRVDDVVVVVGAMDPALSIVDQLTKG